jgi:hypothetical protein
MLTLEVSGLIRNVETTLNKLLPLSTAQATALTYLAPNSINSGALAKKL